MKAKFEIILSILSLIGFLLILYVNIYILTEFMTLNVIIFAAPFIIFGVLSWLKVNNKVTIVNSIIVMMILAIVMFINLFSMLFTTGSTEIKEIRVYERVISYYGYPQNERIAHFPKEIPANATNVRFNEFPQFLQGGSSVKLVFNTSLEEVERYYNKYSDKAHIRFTKGKESTNDNYWYTNSWKEKTGTVILPDGFEILILDSYSSNHGYSYGLAVSRELKEVYFWCSQG